MGIVSNIIRNAIKSDNDKLNIIVAPYDGIFELSLCEHTIHDYYLLSSAQKLAQPEVRHDRLLHLNNNFTNWPISFDFDLIICNDIINQINICSQISKILHIPLLIIHHSLKPPFVKLEDIQILKTTYENNTIIVMDDIINKSWYSNYQVLPYFAKLSSDTQKENKLLIAGTFNPNQLFFIQEIKQKSKIPVTIVGYNNNLSKPVSFLECLELLKTHKIYLNLYNDLELNSLMLYAMSAGCTIISTPSPFNEKFIKHGKNGFIAKTIDEILEYSQQDSIDITINQQIIDDSNKFSETWNKLLYNVSKQPFLG
jgi:hypothetical protein